MCVQKLYLRSFSNYHPHVFEDRHNREIAPASGKTKERAWQKPNVVEISGTQVPCPFER